MSIPNRIAVLNSDGTTDLSFAPGAGLDAAGYSVQAYPEGAIAAGGAFSMVSGAVRAKLAFFDADGTLQADTPTPNNNVRTLALQADGSVLLGGEFTSIDGTTRNRIARLENDLSLEAAYNPNAENTVYGLLNQEDGKTVAVGAFLTMGGVARNHIARLYNDTAATKLSVLSVNLVQWLRSGASPETERVSFEEPAGTAIAGSIARIDGGWQFVPTTPLVGSGTITARAYPTNSHSEGLFEDTVAYNVNPEIQVEEGGTILVDAVSTADYGSKQVGTTTAKTFIITNVGLDVLNLDALPARVVLSGTNADQWAIVSQPASPLDPGESVKFTLNFVPTSEGSNKTATLTINSDDADESTFSVSLTATATPGPGGADSTWAPVLNGFVYSPTLARNDLVWLGGSFTTINGLNRGRYARLDSVGAVQSQTGAGAANNEILAMCQLPDGKCYIGGTFTSVNGVARARIARLNADGSLDASFNLSATVSVNGFALQADGSVLVSMSGVMSGKSYLARLTPSGSVDASFTPNPNGNVYGASVQTDGKIVFWGGFTAVAGNAARGLARLSSDGSFDATLDADCNGFAYSAVIAADGKVVVSGTYTSIGGASRTGVNRLTSVGVHDATFAENATYGVSLVPQCDGKLLIGATSFGALSATERLTRVSAVGVNDATFVASARNWVAGLSVQEDGKVLVTGNFTLAGGATKYAARLLNDKDGAVSEISVISPTEVQWLRGGTLPDCQIVVFDFSQDGGTTWTRLGQATRITGGWSLSSITLPISGILRAQAYIPCGYYNGSTSLHEEQVSFSNLEVADLIIELTSVDGSTIADGGTVAFPGTLPGQSSDIVFTLRNTGFATLSSVAATVSGDFSIISSPAASIAANGSTTATIRFSPSAVGARGPIASTITSSVPGSKNPYTLLLTGNGVAVPTATTGSNSAPASGQRTLNGTFRANHDTATAYFQYKLATASTWMTSSNSTLAGFTNVAVAKTITGLTPGQSYQYRAIIYNAVNSGQTPAAPFVGATLSFTAT